MWQALVAVVEKRIGRDLGESGTTRYQFDFAFPPPPHINLFRLSTGVAILRDIVLREPGFSNPL